MTPEGSADLFRIHYQNAEILTHVVHRQLDPNCDLGQGLGDTWGRVKIGMGGVTRSCFDSFFPVPTYNGGNIT